MPSYFNHSSIMNSRSIGKGTSIWQYCVVSKKAKIGRHCNICSHCFIEDDVKIGDRVTIKNGVQLWNGLRIGNEVFIGPNATFSNDLFPRSKKPPKKFLKTIIEDGASVGAGAVILPGIKIGQKAMIGAGAVVTRSVPPNAIVTGNPARITGYNVNVGGHNRPTRKDNISPSLFIKKIYVEGVRVFSFDLVNDIRGNLTAGELSKVLPFKVKRHFLIFEVPSKETRGEHAHKKCHQLLICVNGSCSVVVDDGKRRQEIILNKPNIGLYVPPLIWSIQYKYSHDAILLVLASHCYDNKDYIRNYGEFIKIKTKC